RKRIGTGLLESFSENCEHCQGRGVVIKDQPVDPDAAPGDGEGRRTGRRRGRRTGNGDENGGADSNGNGNGNGHGHAPSPKDIAAMARHERPVDEEPAEAPAEEPADASDDTDAQPAQPEATPEGASPEQASDEAEPVIDSEQAPEPEAPTAPEAAEEAPAAEEKPRVVTRTRRRAASRPAGPPALPATSSNGAAGTLPGSGAIEPATAGGEPGETLEAASAEAPHVEHVPIKKKGSRKR
ncbi:MAG TPA: hypothetical protein VGV65_11995, partial [Nocardioides sp.]|nr:hypothetical protein [Nocardioides sp.]